MAHLGACVVLLGASTHNVAAVCGALSGRADDRLKREKVFAAVAFYSFLVCFVIGIVIYPAFRWYVRAEYFDASLPWATGLFEIKEHLLSLAFVIGLGQFLLSRRIDLEKDREFLPLYAFFTFAFWAVVLYSSVTGALLVILRSV